MVDFITYSKSCTTTVRISKKEKRTAWKIFCTNLNPSATIHYLWHTTRLFKKCVVPTPRPINDDWFDGFYTKVVIFL
jgi:hypothetical protein